MSSHAFLNVYKPSHSVTSSFSNEKESLNLKNILCFFFSAFLKLCEDQAGSLCEGFLICAEIFWL